MNAISSFFKSKKKIYWMIAALAVIVLIWLGTGFASATTDKVSVTENAKVVSLQVKETVETSGSLETQPFAALNWKTSGVVETVYVQPGDMVKAGDVLLTLRPDSTSANLASAQADLEAARANLRALTSPDGSSVGKVREDASKAFDAWNKSREKLMNQASFNQGKGDDATYDDLVNARDDLKDALDNYPLAANSDAQFYYWAARSDALGYTGDFDFTALTPSLRAKLDKDTAAYVDEILRTQSEFEMIARSFAESMEDQQDAIEMMTALGAYEQSADALLDSLQASYQVMVSPSATDLKSAQARVDAAQASVNSLSIVAPFDGQVLSVDDRVGDTVTAGRLSVNLADVSHLYVEAQVDESDVEKVREGTPAEVTLDAAPGVTLTGRVTVVNPVGQAVGGLVKYTVRIDLDPVKDIFLPLGATANVVIKIDGSQSTLAVPIVAIKNDAQGEYVWVVRDGVPVRVNVVGGAIIDDMVAVTGDLQAGEILQIVHENSFGSSIPFAGGQ
jgi:RND family efflux transporter MFP subunit